MCTVVFIAADKPLPLVTWNEENPSFTVIELHKTQEWVQKQFSKEFVYELGSAFGCGCGFGYGFNEPQNDEQRKDEEEARKSVQELSAYLSQVIQFSSIEIFANDGNEWNFDEIERLTVTPKYFGGDSFDFEGMKLITVISD